MDEENFTEEEARRFLQELHDKEKKIIEANRGRPGRAEGIKQLLTQLYPDEAHFIYELLQNAEDASATGVSFNLQREGLIVSHDGRQLFTSKNVDAITNIDTTKREDVNQIGKFGIGFKAVYSYTYRPRIYSGPFKFEIRELFCPFPLYDEPDPFPLNSKHTYFIFPFPGEKKTPEKCFEEIEAGLRALDERAILFLNNIQRISWKVAGENGGSVARAKNEGNIVTIEKCCEGRTLPESVWLKFDRKFTRRSDESLRCSVAFSLQAKGDTRSLSEGLATLREQWEIIPVNGQAHIYFPAIKETTKLKFHVHAPFSAPVDRASVKDNSENRELVKELGTLIADSLNVIRDAGLLTRSFLAVLPNVGDEVPPLWNPIFESVVRAFKECDLLPTADGKYVRATIALHGDRDIRKVISAGDVCFLTGKQELVWAVDVPVDDKRGSAFLDALDLAKFSWKELVQAIGQKCRRGWSNPNFGVTETWLKSKDGKWLGRLYAILDKAADETKSYHGVCHELVHATIIRLASGSYTEGFAHPFFSPTMRLPRNLEFPNVDDSVFEEVTGKQAEAARSFLKKVGVKEVNEDEVVAKLLEKFYGDEALDVPEAAHLQHLKLFMDWSDKSKKFDVFEDSRLFRAADGTLSLPAQIYLDTPFSKTGLAAIFSPEWKLENPRQPLWDGYFDKFQTDAVTRFAEACGVLRELAIVQTDACDNPKSYWLCWDWQHVRRTSTGTNEDYWIPNIDVWLASPTLDASLHIWKVMAAASPKYFTARYRPNSDPKHKFHEAPSRLLAALSEGAWVPDHSGSFKKPADLSRETLHPDFKFDEGYGWLTKVGFGDNVQRATQEYADRVKMLSDFDVPRKLANKLMSLTGDERQQLFRKLESDLERSVEFPEKPVPDIERRTARATELARKATRRTSETRDREVRVTQGEVDACTWLRQEYTNKADVMFCQMQGSAPKIMPFKYPDENGKFYFDACEFLGDLTVELRANYLALSPDCAAEFKHACPLTDNEKRERVLAIDPNASPESLILELDTPVHGRLRFTQAHLVDLQAAIRALG